MSEHHIALCSGGADSVAATHAAMVFGPAEEVVFLHTGTEPAGGGAISETIDWLREWCAENDWPFEVVETPNSYREIVREHGYPGPSRHFLLYRELKDDAIDRYRKRTDGELHCWTGIRRFESDQRMQVAEANGERGDGRWYWHAPLVNWADEQVCAYRERFGIDVAPVVKGIGRSADCWCGCFGDRAELTDLEAAGFSEHAEWLRGFETPIGCSREQDVWAGYNWEKHDFAAVDGQQLSLCSACALPDGGDSQ